MSRKKIEFENLFHIIKDYFAISDTENIIISPFISVSVLDSILHKSEIKRITIVTSWRSDHLISGISSLELFSLCQKNNWTLLINDELHLKLYSNNLEDAWIGSANITNKALQDGENENIEGLYRISNLSLEDKIFIQHIISSSTIVTKNIYETYLKWIEEIEILTPPVIKGPEIKKLIDSDYLITKLPAIYSPSHLYDLCNEKVQPISEWGEERAMIHDLDLYRINEWGRKDIFLKKLKENFFENPFTRAFSEIITLEGVRFGYAKEWIQNNCTTIPTPYRRELTETVQCLFNWFVELAPSKYEIYQPNYTQILRLKEI